MGYTQRVHTNVCTGGCTTLGMSILERPTFQGEKVMHIYLRLTKFLFLIGILGLSACATIVEGSSQSLFVNTEPAQASCKLIREGAVLAVVNPSPEAVTLEKSKDAINIECTKEGFFDEHTLLASSFQGMTVGNIIFGGIIGVGIDAASGAMNEYPESVTILMTPTSFDSETNRDKFFEKRNEFLTSETDRRVKKIRKDCLPDVQSECEDQVKELEIALADELKLIESRRLNSKINGNT